MEAHCPLRFVCLTVNVPKDSIDVPLVYGDIATSSYSTPFASHMHGPSPISEDISTIARAVQAPSIHKIAPLDHPDLDPLDHRALEGFKSILTPRKEHQQRTRASIDQALRSSSPPTVLCDDDDSVFDLVPYKAESGLVQSALLADPPIRIGERMLNLSASIRMLSVT